MPLGVLGVLPLTVPMTAPRIVASVALLSGAFCCVRLNPLSADRVDVLLRERRVRRRGREITLDELEAWVLGAGGTRSGSSYEVQLRLRGGELWTVLADSDPAHLLRQLARAKQSLDLPVITGWGLPARARPWAVPAGAAGSLPAAGDPLRWPVQAAQGRITLALVIGALMVALILGVLGGTRLLAGHSIAAMSAGLAAALVALLFVIAAAVATEHVTLSLHPRLIGRWRRLGLKTGPRLDLPASELCGAYIVESGFERHLLLLTMSGPHALPYHPPTTPPQIAALVGELPEQGTHQGRGITCRAGAEPR